MDFKKLNVKSNFILGIVIGLTLAGGAAFSATTFNTPATGYLLCVNQKTKVVTYPATQKCPSGSIKLITGAQGPKGEQGLQGPVGQVGPAGIEGPPGIQGVSGLTGAVGPQGLKGETGAKGETGSQGPKGDSIFVTRPIKAVTTFTNVGLIASPTKYSAVLPIRASMFIAGKTWYRLDVSMTNYSPKVSGQLQCQIMPMDSFTGDQRSGTTVNSSFILFAGYQSTQAFGGEFVYYGGDYVLACKTDADVYVSATVKLRQSDAVDYVD